MGGGIFGLIKDLPYKTKADAWKPFRIDAATHSIQTIDYAHHEVHGGSSYWMGYNDTLANGEAARLCFTTPNTTKWFHWTLNSNVWATATLTLDEALTSYSGAGAATPVAYNRHRNSTNTSGILSPLAGKTGGTLVTPVGGTTIYEELMSSSKGVHFERSSGEEIILKQNTKYMVEILNDVNANTVTILMEWYEHTDKD